MNELAKFVSDFGPVISAFLVGISSNLGTEVIKTFSVYEISNLKRFFSSAKFDLDTFKSYAQTPEGLRTLSLVLDKVRSEVFAAKLESWGSVTSSIISGSYDTQESFNKRDYFILKFSEMTDFALRFLASLGKSDSPYDQMYTTVEGGNQVVPGKEDTVLGQIFTNINGFSEIYQVSNPPTVKTYIRLSPLGREFLRFIHDEREKMV